MLTIILLSIGLPVLAGTVYLAARDRRPQFLADVRGIALQTVIIMVVLLAIAGAVAGVLLTRGGAEVERLEGDPAIAARTAAAIQADLVANNINESEAELECRAQAHTWTPDQNGDGDAVDTGEGCS